jgi:DNA-binding MarR family transcriptional regulator/N-acetylglutamate synthase-like GNAT family acetyltransferase
MPAQAAKGKSDGDQRAATGRRASGADPYVEAMRRFSRFYTRKIGLLQEEFLGTDFSLTEGRVLYELAHKRESTAAAVGAALALDAGYLSRILSSFEKKKLITKTASPTDRRQSILTLTERGRKAFAPLEARSSEQVGKMIATLPESKKRELVDAMQTVENLLGSGGVEVERAKPTGYVLRPPQVGDLGWIVHRQGALYWQEYGYDERFEALCAEIVAKFVQNLDAKRERCWIAEKDEEIVGSVFLVKESEKTAKLRLLYVEPSARGLGIGARLVAECVRFARQAGYEKIVLWTQSELDAARHVYEKAGFRVVEKKEHHSFSKDLTAEVWELAL